MSRTNLPEQVRHGTCRVCGEACTAVGRTGFYHDDRHLGAVHGVRPHFASPMAVA